jgi:hypothetical protein
MLMRRMVPEKFHPVKSANFAARQPLNHYFLNKINALHVGTILASILPKTGRWQELPADRSNDQRERPP